MLGRGDHGLRRIRAFGDGYETEVPARRDQVIVPADHAEDRDALRGKGFAQHLLVACRSRPG